MKFLHLSDLHIGKSVNGLSMLDEQRHVLRQIIRHIRTERPAAVLIAGDVYDRPAPGGEAMRLFDDFLTALADEEVSVLLISGNHDSPEQLSYASRLLADRRLFLCGTFDGKIQSVTLPDEYGEVCFWLLPFLRPSSVRGLFGEKKIDSYGDALSAAIGRADIAYSARNVLVAHQFFTKSGVVAIRSDSEINPVGGLDAIDAGLVERFDYVALGHLHGAQRVGAEHIRYCGSPLKYSASEARQAKAATLVELREKGSLTVTALPLTPLHDMRQMRGTLAELVGEGTLSVGREDYLYITLTDEEELVDPLGKLRSVYPNILGLSFDNARARVDLSDIAADLGRTVQLSPYDLFGEFFLEMNGSVMSGEQQKIAREIWAQEAIE